MHHIYSTLASGNRYTIYKEGGGDLPVVAGQVLIKGGTGVVGKKHIETPLGVHTAVTDDEMEILRQCADFIRHEKAGYIKVEHSEKRPEKVVKAGMVERDVSAPKTPLDYHNASRKPVVNAIAS